MYFDADIQGPKRIYAIDFYWSHALASTLLIQYYLIDSTEASCFKGPIS